MKKIYLKAYLKQNFGDDLFVHMITSRYSNCEFISTSSFKYNEINPNLKVIKLNFFTKLFSLFTNRKINFDDILNRITKFTILIGGSMFIEKKQKGQHPLSKRKPYYILGSNFGPYETESYYTKCFELFKNAEDVCFRDSYSYELYKQLPNVRKASDIVFSLDISNVKLQNSKKVIISVINLKNRSDLSQLESEYNNRIIELINFFTKKNYEVCLISFCKFEGDEDAIENILNNLDDATRRNVQKHYYHGNIKETLEVMGNSQIIIGTRFHANILGMLMNKTVIPIAYSDKTLNVLNDIGFEGKIFDIRKMEDFRINSLTNNDLIYKIDINRQIKDSKEHFSVLDKNIK